MVRYLKANKSCENPIGEVARSESNPDFTAPQHLTVLVLNTGGPQSQVTKAGIRVVTKPAEKHRYQHLTVNILVPRETTYRVTIQRAKTISNLYEEVADYDLVITVDAPLSLALNRRIETPRLGRFAVTPRMLASGELRPQDDRELFFELIERTDLSWKQANYVLETVLGCWEETGDSNAIREYERFDTPETRTALSVLRDAESAHHDLSSYVIDPDLSVAAIGIEQFSTLDKSVLPPEYDTVSPLESGTFDIPEFRVFDSATAIVETLVENVSSTNARDIAVVMDQGSEYPALVESAFEAADVSYHGGPGFTDNEGIRTCLQILRAAYCGSDLRLEDVRPILSYIGVNSAVTEDQKRFHEIDDPDLRPLQELCQSMAGCTFDDVLNTVDRISTTTGDIVCCRLHSNETTTRNVGYCTSRSPEPRAISCFQPERIRVRSSKRYRSLREKSSQNSRHEQNQTLSRRSYRSRFRSPTRQWGIRRIP